MFIFLCVSLSQWAKITQPLNNLVDQNIFRPLVLLSARWNNVLRLFILLEGPLGHLLLLLLAPWNKIEVKVDSVKNKTENRRVLSIALAKKGFATLRKNAEYVRGLMVVQEEKKRKHTKFEKWKKSLNFLTFRAERVKSLAWKFRFAFSILKFELS